MNPILDSGTDAVFTVDIMRKLGVSSVDLMFPENIKRFHSIIQYLQNHPEPEFFISKVKLAATAVQPVDKLRIIDEYVGLQKSRAELESKIKNISEEISLYER